MKAIYDYFINASPGEVVLGLVFTALVVRGIYELIFEDVEYF